VLGKPRQSPPMEHSGCLPETTQAPDAWKEQRGVSRRPLVVVFEKKKLENITSKKKTIHAFVCSLGV
jgi:hypothetical protein